MKNIKIFLIIAIAAFISFSCEDDKEKVVLESADAVASSLVTPADGSAFQLILAQGKDTFETFTWTAADYGAVIARNYSLQLDKANGDFTSAVELANTANLQFEITNSELNLLLFELGMKTATSQDVDLKVVSIVSNSAVDTLYSKVNSISITPFEYNLPNVILPVDGSDFVLEADTLGVEDFETINWKAVDYGFNATVNYALELDHPDSVFSNPIQLYLGGNTEYTPKVLDLNNSLLKRGYVADVAADVEFRVISDIDGKGKVNSDVFIYTITPFSSEVPDPTPDNYWAVVGSATPNGWGDPDIDMEWDWETNVWTVTTDLIAGEFKFRADDDWAVNYGDNDYDGTLEQDGANIPLAEDGNYTIKLILTDIDNPTYTVVKN